MKIPTLEEYKQKINEDFFNPFDEEDFKEVKPKHISDKGGSLMLRKETFNLARIEYAKRPGGEFTIIAKTQFAKGEIVEICPVIILGEESKTVTNLKDIIFELDKDTKEYALVLGYGSLYKHSENANVDYAYNKLTKQMYFITKKTINLHEELTINYGQDYWQERLNLNMMSDINNINPNQGMPSTSKLKTESEVQPNAADLANSTNNRVMSSPENPANTVRSGIAIMGSGQS